MNLWCFICLFMLWACNLTLVGHTRYVSLSYKDKNGPLLKSAMPGFSRGFFFFIYTKDYLDVSLPFCHVFWLGVIRQCKWKWKKILISIPVSGILKPGIWYTDTRYLVKYQYWYQVTGIIPIRIWYRYQYMFSVLFQTNNNIF